MSPVANFGRTARFSSRDQRDFIEGHARTMIHSIGLKCPCRGDDAFASMINDGQDAITYPYHALCKNDRWLYRDPKPVNGLVVGIGQQVTPLEMGWAQPGDMIFAPQMPGEDDDCDARPIGQWDRLTSTWEQPLDGGQVIIRGAAHAAGNRGLDGGLRLEEDRLWYEPSSAIWCEDEDGVKYDEGDFILGPGKKIAWTDPQRSPRVGKRYALKYNAILEWIAVIPPMERYDGADSIGQRVLLRKLHLERVNQSSAQTPDAAMAKQVI